MKLNINIFDLFTNSMYRTDLMGNKKYEEIPKNVVTDFLGGKKNKKRTKRRKNRRRRTVKKKINNMLQKYKL